MTKLGRRPHDIAPHQWKITIPSDLAAEVELLLFDPLTGKPQYGGRAKLLEVLLREWVARRRKEHLTSAGQSDIIGADGDISVPTTPQLGDPQS